MIFTPLRFENPLFLLGTIIFLIGFKLEASALYHFRRTPVGKPVETGPYRLSRNPQWLGLFFVLLGSAMAAGIWVYISIIVVVGLIYHRQILDEETACIKRYGEGYRQ
ncbi:MAG: methyltransferase [Anaerolineales bacterium]